MSVRQSLKIKYSSKRQNLIGGFIKNVNYFKMANIWVYCSTAKLTAEINRMRNKKKSEIYDRLNDAPDTLGISGLNQSERIEVVAFNDNNHLHFDDMVILYFTPSFASWTFNGIYHLPKSNDDIAWAETFTDTKGEEVKLRYGIRIDEAEGIKTKSIIYDREIWENAVNNYMKQVQTAIELEQFKYVDAIVIDDNSVELNYFALSNLGQFIENQLA